jgi:hypothetical protein
MIASLTTRVQDCIQQSACAYVEFQPEDLGPWGSRRRPLHTLLDRLIVAHPQWRFGLTGSDAALALLALISGTPLQIGAEFVFVHSGETDDPNAVRLGFALKSI